MNKKDRITFIGLFITSSTIMVIMVIAVFTYTAEQIKSKNIIDKTIEQRQAFEQKRQARELTKPDL